MNHFTRLDNNKIPKVKCNICGKVVICSSYSTGWYDNKPHYHYSHVCYGSLTAEQLDAIQAEEPTTESQTQ